MRKNEKGFGAIELLLIIVVVGLLFAAGWLFFDRRKDKITTNSKNTTASKPIENKQAKQQQAMPKVSVINEKDLQGVSFVAPKCGTQAALLLAQPNELDLKYAKPESWATMYTYPNGIAYKSPDFTSEKGFSKISKGASLFVRTEAIRSEGSGLAKDMQAYALIETMTPAAKLTYIKVADYYGVKFAHNHGENHNNHEVALLFKNKRMYTIEEEFNYSAANPYPQVVDQILNSIE